MKRGWEIEARIDIGSGLGIMRRRGMKEGRKEWEWEWEVGRADDE